MVASCVELQLFSNKLEIASWGNKPTFVIAIRKEVLYLTIETPIVSLWIRKWHVSWEESLSDHKYNRLDIETLTVEETKYRNSRTCNWATFKERLRQG